MSDTATVLADLLRASLDDCRVKLGPRTERRLLDRMTELAQISHYEIVVAHLTPPNENEDRPKPWFETKEARLHYLLHTATASGAPAQKPRPRSLGPQIVPVGYRRRTERNQQRRPR